MLKEVMGRGGVGGGGHGKCLGFPEVVLRLSSTG